MPVVHSSYHLRRTQASECASTAVASLCKAEGGAQGVLAVRGMLEGLIACAQSGSAAKRKGGMMALHSLAQDTAAVQVLARNGVACEPQIIIPRCITPR